MQNEILKKLKRDKLVLILQDYFKSIGQEKYPPIEHYSLHDLRKSIKFYGVEIKIS